MAANSMAANSMAANSMAANSVDALGFGPRGAPVLEMFVQEALVRDCSPEAKAERIPGGFEVQSYWVS
jgi:hypothetical protein